MQDVDALIYLCGEGFLMKGYFFSSLEDFLNGDKLIFFYFSGFLGVFIGFFAGKITAILMFLYTAV